MTFSDLLRTLAQSIATFVEAIGVAIVAVGVILACYRYLGGLATRVRPFPPEGLRLALGRSLALSLEFLLGRQWSTVWPATPRLIEPGVELAARDTSAASAALGCETDSETDQDGSRHRIDDLLDRWRPRQATGNRANGEEGRHVRHISIDAVAPATSAQ